MTRTKVPRGGFKNLEFRTKISLLITAAFLLLFFLFRLLILNFYSSAFAEMTFFQTLNAFAQGLRFDFSMISVFVLPLVFLLNLPFINKFWSKFLLALITIIFLIFTLVLSADFIYFDYVKRHMAQEVLAIGNDMGFIFKYAFTRALIPALLVLAGFAAALYAGLKTAGRYFSKPALNIKKEIIRFFIIAAIIFLGVRGKIFDAGKPLGLADVYNYARGGAAVNLTLNGVFTSYHTGRKGVLPVENNVPFDIALEEVKKIVSGDNAFFPDPQNYPLMRQIKPGKEFKNHNVFVVLLEGWTPDFIDSLSDKKEKTGVTPRFDEIVKKSVVMTNAYASGARSIAGFGSAFAGVPTFPDLPVFGYGMELLSAMPAVGKAFKEQGYYSIFTQASPRDSYRLCALASGVMGVDGSYGKEDLPELLPYKESAAFGYDYDALMFTADKIKDKNNFIAFVFTAITHAPFTVTLPEFQKYTDGSWQSGFYNALYFADYSIGKLIEKAKTEGWHDNTVFIFIADHTPHQSDVKDIRRKYRIPFVIYAPEILKPQKINYTVSQSDMLPTVYDLLNVPSAYTAVGKSVFAGPENRAAFFASGMTMGLVADGGAIEYSGGEISGEQINSPDFDKAAALKQLLSINKACVNLIRENRWYHGR